MTAQTKISFFTLKYMAFAAIGFFLWSCGDTAVRFMNDANIYALAFWGSFFSSFFALLFAPLLGGISDTARLPELPLRLLRGAIISISTLFAYLSFAYLELTTAYALIFIAPFLVKIFSVLINGEVIRPQSWLISALGFLGVLIVLRPGYVPLNIGSISAIALAVFWALGQIMARKIWIRNQTPLSLSLFQDLFLAFGMALYLLLYEGVSAFILPVPYYIICALIGIVSIIASILVARAFANVPAAHIAPVHYTQMIWGGVFGILIFDEYPDLWTLIGSAIIIFAGLLLIRYSRSV